MRRSIPFLLEVVPMDCGPSETPQTTAPPMVDVLMSDPARLKELRH